MIKKQCDVLVIGGGPGGYSAAIHASQLGLKVIIVEKDNFGGTCLNVGCIPTKAFVHLANVYETIKKSKNYGIQAHFDSMDLEKFQEEKDTNVKKLVGGVEFLVKSSKAEIVKGKAHFVSPYIVNVEKENDEVEEITAEHIILAMGTRPKVIPGLEFDHDRILSSTDALDLKMIPKRTAIVGAGVVGMEFASILSRLGSKVTVIEMMDRVLPTEDRNAVDVLQKSMRKDGVEFFVAAEIKEIIKHDSTMELRIKTGPNASVAEVDKLIVAAGRETNLDGIGLEKTGVKTVKGRIEVDEHMRTSVEHIYAVGDIVPSVQLAHVAYEEGYIAAENIAGKNTHVSYDVIPRCTYTSPEVCAVGITEEEAKERNIKFKSYKVSFGAIGKAVIEGKDEGFVKIIVDETYGEILGCTIVGYGISELISGPSIAMAMEGTIEALADTVIAHPSLSEAIKEVALLATGKPLHVK